MARTIDTIRQTYHRTDEVEKLRSIQNAILDELTALYAKLDADAGVTDTNYGATIATTHKTATTDG